MSERLVGFLLQDLAMYINEVKRDNETLKKISEFQSSIENLVSRNVLISFCEIRGLLSGLEKKMEQLGFLISQYRNKQMTVQSYKMSRRERCEEQKQKTKQVFQLFLERQQGCELF